MVCRARSAVVAAMCLALVAGPGLAAARTVIIGDSIMAGRDGFWGQPDISKRLEELSGTKVENKAVIGASLHEGWVKSIPTLYDEVVKNSSVPNIIVMNGGGNDVFSIRDDCIKFNEGCKWQIDSAMVIAGGLLDRMATDGVEHVIYLGFYQIDKFERVVEYGSEGIKAVCAKAKVDCHFADARDLVFKKGFDGIHPGRDGYRKLAERIYETSVKAKITL